MTPRKEHRNDGVSKPCDGRLSHEDHRELDDFIRGRLDVPKAPDLTRSIMGRLGYMRVQPQVSRRHRVMRWTMRCMLVVLAGVAVALGLTAYQASPEARHPAAVTIPMAVTQDLHQHQVRFGTVLRLLQEVPVQWDGTIDVIERNGEVFDDQPVDFDGDPAEIADEVNRSAVAPVRWV